MAGEAKGNTSEHRRELGSAGGGGHRRRTDHARYPAGAQRQPRRHRLPRPGQGTGGGRRLRHPPGLRQLRGPAGRPGHRRRLHSVAQPVTRAVGHPGHGRGQTRAVREATEHHDRRRQRTHRGPRPHRPAHRRGPVLPQPPAVADRRRPAGDRRHRRDRVRARHHGQGLPRSGGHPQQSGRGRRLAVRHGPVRDQRLQPALSPATGQGRRRARNTPRVRRRRPIQRPARLWRSACLHHRQHPQRPHGLGLPPATHRARNQRVDATDLPLRPWPADALHESRSATPPAPARIPPVPTNFRR